MVLEPWVAFIGWLFYALIFTGFEDNIKEFISGLVQSVNPANLNAYDGNLSEFVRGLANNTIIGIALGTGLISYAFYGGRTLAGSTKFWSSNSLTCYYRFGHFSHRIHCRVLH